MFFSLLLKDLARLRRNPGPLLLMLAMPTAITGLVGIAFRGDGGASALPAIRVALVDEDQALLGGMLVTAFDQAPLDFQIEAMPRDAAETALRDQELSAIIILPNQLTENLLAGTPAPEIILKKNPTQTYLPAVVQETLLLFVEALNALVRNLGPELEELNAQIQQSTIPDAIVMGRLTQDVFAKFQVAEAYLFPPLIGYTNTRETTEAPVQNTNLFGYLLPGISALFLLFLADIGVRDLFREQELRTFDRFRTCHTSSLPLVLSKALYAAVVTIAGALILLGGGSLLFGIQWANPLSIFLLVLAYGVYASGLLIGLTALVGTEKRANALNTLVLMAIGFLGGSMLPIEQLPKVLTETISPHLPNYWFARTMIAFEYQVEGPALLPTLLKMVVLGVLFILLAARSLDRRAAAGVKP